MSLLELYHVSKRVRHGSDQLDALCDVSLELDPGELLAVWGVRRSGRSTLLRVASGIEPPDHGTVYFSGKPLAAIDAVSGGIAYCRGALPLTEGHAVLEAVAACALARGESSTAAGTHARAALERTGASHCCERQPRELDSDETVRVAIARALTTNPSLLVIDEPTKGVNLLERDGILKLLRALAGEGIGILASVGETTGLFGADRALSLSNGQIHGILEPDLAPVVRLGGRVSI